MVIDPATRHPSSHSNFSRAGYSVRPYYQITTYTYAYEGNSAPMPPHQIPRFASGPTLAYHQQQFQSHAAQSHAAAHQQPLAANHQQPLAGSHSYIHANAQLNAFQNSANGGLAGVGGLNAGASSTGPVLPSKALASSSSSSTAKRSTR
ncbi:unnamed protein product [Parascedosporium putredinis]|uniref:Uncharacterized protein n=1 Tax=Parascedosporium putredinis TaxID=1442378 RepID=A0A9P1M6T6_9PEZI|nr:unnamed protein product [Parascedosporium putredinis]CAI7989055.1 unnamed protein product [Parascedosporium putredinis]